MFTPVSITGVNNHNPDHDIEHVVRDATKRLHLLKGADIRGRTSADAAFCFALAGVNCETLFELLGDVATNELSRFGTRASCKPNQICHMVEKLAAAGIQRDEIQTIASRILRDKHHEDLSNTLSGEDFGFFSDMPLLWLWRFSAKQSKVIPAQVLAAAHENKKYDWHQLFTDPSRPLVIDLGSGMGISLLGLAKSSLVTESDVIDDIDWSSCNFLGVELNPTLVAFGRGMASRWGLADVLQFTSAPAEVLIESVSNTYPGNTTMVMIQFPTPFRLLQADDDTTPPTDDTTTRHTMGGNPQLPSKSDFMVIPRLLTGIKRALTNQQGYLLIQSNAEDVAVHMKHQAETMASFSSVDVPFPVLFDDQDICGRRRLSWRTKRMLEHGGQQRAHGSAWSKESILPIQSETEVSCMLNDTPIHRCVLR